jgi:23S rRNA (pseudouridine1915-N3)-methyltransferase
MKILLLSIQSQKAKEYESVLDLLAKKIKRLYPFEYVQLSSAKFARDHSTLKIRAEGEKILQYLHPDDRVYVCDESGEVLDSIAFSRRFERDLNTNAKRLVVIIGGAFGLDDSVKNRAAFIWSLSPLVVNHHVAQIIAIEQIYRALTIQKNLPYHNL